MKKPLIQWNEKAKGGILVNIVFIGLSGRRASKNVEEGEVRRKWKEKEREIEHAHESSVSILVVKIRLKSERPE